MHILKKPILLCAVIAALISISGCGVRPAANPAQTPPPPTATPLPSATPAVVEPTPQQQEKLVYSYYGDSDGTKLVETETIIRYVDEEEKYLAALNLLKESPDADLYPLSPNMTFLLVELDEGLLTVDLSFPDEDRLGVTGEWLLLEALSETIFQFEEVDAFQLLVEGESVESLMGHYELHNPFMRDSN